MSAQLDDAISVALSLQLAMYLVNQVTALVDHSLLCTFVVPLASGSPCRSAAMQGCWEELLGEERLELPLS